MDVGPEVLSMEREAMRPATAIYDITACRLPALICQLPAGAAFPNVAKAAF